MPDSAPTFELGGEGLSQEVERDSAKATRRRGLTVALPLIAVALVAVGLFFFAPQTGDYDVGQNLDADLCRSGPSGLGGPSEDGQDITGSATYLLDLRKPIGDPTAPGKSLNEIARRLQAGTELRVYALTENAAAPRRLLDRFCKPYGEREIVVRAAKDQGKGERDCDELPAQVSQRVRDLATRFCARRDALRGRIDRLAAKVPRVVANAYLVEALEHTAAAFAERPKPWHLYVFSDMLQHADWYSHLDLGWTGWDFALFAARHAERQTSLPDVAMPQGERLPVTVFYPPRRRVTESLRPRYAHQTFWRRYFATLATQRGEVDFVELSRAPVMEVARLMVTPAEELAREVAAVLEDTERRRKAAARSEAALAELESAAPAAAAPPSAGPGPATAATQSAPRPPAEPAAEPFATRPATPPATVPSRESAPARPAENSAAANRHAMPPAPASEEEPAVPAPLLADTLAPAEVAGFAAGAAAAAGEAALPACVISLKPEFASSLAPGGYPGGRRVNFGAAVVQVRYTVDDQGRTVDATVVANVEGVAAANSANLAEDTAAEVRRWEFTLPAGGDCALAPQVATFTYAERCRGSPVPTCRTVRKSVTVF